MGMSFDSLIFILAEGRPNIFSGAKIRTLSNSESAAKFPLVSRLTEEYF